MSSSSSSPKSSIYPEMRPVVGNGIHNKQYVPAIMNYVSPSTTVAHVHRATSGDDGSMLGIPWQPCQVNILNGRYYKDDESSGDNNKDNNNNKSSFALHPNGFQLLQAPLDWDSSKKDNDGDDKIDFLDTDDVIDRYYPECERLVRDCFLHQAQQQGDGDDLAAQGGVQVYAFDHNIRIAQVVLDNANNNQDDNNADKEKKSGGGKPQVPLGLVHGDYTLESSVQRLHDLRQTPKMNDVLKSRLGDRPLLPAADDESRRFALVNVWRNIDRQHPVQSFPLACVDVAGSQVHTDDLRTLLIHYADRVGQNYLVAAPSTASTATTPKGSSSSTTSKPDDTTTPASTALQQQPKQQNRHHQWVYFDEMTHDEALLIKQWDSQGGIAQGEQEDSKDTSTFCIHSAFALPTDDGNEDKLPPPPRQSIEVRCICLWPAGSSIKKK